jgi:hypothetical protein
MYAKLNYVAGMSTPGAQVLADISDLLLGETVVGDLNADSGSIVTTYTTVAYTLFDNVSTEKQVFRIPIHDDPTVQFVYMELFVYSTDEIHIKMWGAWDAGTHVGSGDSTYYASSVSKLVDLQNYTTSAASIEITATDRHMLINTVYNSGTKLYLRGYLQWDRGEAWDTAANGYLPVMLCTAANMAGAANYPLPHMRSDGAVYSSTSAPLYMATRYGSSQLDQFYQLIGGDSSAARGLDSALASVHNMYEFGFSYLSSGERFLTGKIPDMYLATYQNGAQGDALTIDSNAYMIWEASTTFRLAIRAG